jgi:hypothetical protein
VFNDTERTFGPTQATNEPQSDPREFAGRIPILRRLLIVPIVRVEAWADVAIVLPFRAWFTANRCLSRR